MSRSTVVAMGLAALFVQSMAGQFAVASNITYGPWVQTQRKGAYSCEFTYPDKANPYQRNKQTMKWYSNDPIRRGYCYAFTQDGKCWAACVNTLNRKYDPNVMQWSKVMPNGQMVAFPPGYCPAPKNGDPQGAGIDNVPPPPASGDKVQLVMSRLECDKTTEHGADEVYIIVTGLRSDGTQFFTRWPSDNPNQASGHWDMNDGNQPTDAPQGQDSHVITNKPMFNGELPPGSTWDLSVIVMEEDGGNSKQIQQIGSAALLKSGNPYSVGAGAILKGLTELGFNIVSDTDDYIGSFGVSIRDDGSGRSVTWKVMDRAEQKPSTSESKADFHFNGDHSDYSGQFEVR